MAGRGVRVYLQVEPALALQRLQTQQELAITQNIVFEARPLLAGPDLLPHYITCSLHVPVGIRKLN